MKKIIIIGMCMLLVILISGCIEEPTYYMNYRVCDAEFKNISPDIWHTTFLDNDKCRVCGSDYVWNESINDWSEIQECSGGNYEYE